jgi:YgiT-type zinc finger domain-containing protein
MKCHQCGSELAKTATDLPFKTDVHSIIIIKDLPVLQCRNCGEYLIEDAVMARVDAILKNIGTDVEVEILSYAA